MSLLKALKECIGRRCVVVHNEGDKTHTLVGMIKDVDECVLTIITDYGVKNLVPVVHLLKIKVLRGE